MKITFITPHAGYSGGIRVVAILAERLKRRGHEVCVVSQPLPWVGLKDRIKMRLRPHTRPDWMNAKGGHMDGVPVEHRVLDTPRPVEDRDLPDADVLIASWWETAEWIQKVSARKGKKVYFIQGDELTLCKDESARQRLLATWRLPMPKITVAGWLKRLGQERCPGHEISLVPNTVDLERFRASPRGKQATPTIGMIHSNVHIKGADIMLGAYEIARRSIPNLRLVAFGESAPKLGPKWPADLPFEVRPSQARIAEIYSSCDAWLFGSRVDGFGLSIVEAMACRTPVIGTPAGAAPELLAGGGGFLVKPEDSADMAAAIVRVERMSDPEWRAMSDAAHRTASSYSWDDAAALFESALQKAVEPDPTGVVART